MSPLINYSFIQIFQVATTPPGGTVVMVLIVATLQIRVTTSSLAAASRWFWLFSRNHGVPGFRLFSKLKKKTPVPFFAVTCTAIIIRGPVEGRSCSGCMLLNGRHRSIDEVYDPSRSGSHGVSRLRQFRDTGVFCTI
jgi:hypothetical protein